MLVLTRRPSQRVICPELGLTLTVLEARDGRVKLGIEAPRHLKFFREEVLQQMERAGEVPQSIGKVA